MKRYIRSAKESKVYNYHLDEEDFLPLLKIKVADVRHRVLENILEQDKPIFEYLVENRAIPTLLTSHDLRNNPYYDIEDKLIRLASSRDGYRVYDVPYIGSGRMGEGDIYDKSISVNDDGEIMFEGSLRWIDPESVKPSTLKSYFFRS